MVHKDDLCIIINPETNYLLERKKQTSLQTNTYSTATQTKPINKKKHTNNSRHKTSRKATKKQKTSHPNTQTAAIGF
jgi:hypothetical protein